MKTIRELKAEGYEGTDASLNTSLHEYGLAWKSDGDDYKFLYAHPGAPKRFDWGNLRKDTDPRKEWNWIDWENVALFCGQTVEELLATPLPMLVYTLVIYHGAENIFGASYTEGWEIEDTDS